jgi:hypothetical protein
MILKSLVAGLIRGVEPRRLVLGLALVCLLTVAAQGQYVVKYAARPPTGPADAIWATANPMGPFYWIDGSAENAPSSDLAIDARYLWDGTNLYGRIMVTDTIHANLSPDPPPYTNQWNMDDVEFYVNAINTNSTVWVAGTTEDDWGINSLGHLNLSTTINGATNAINNVIGWTDPLFDPTGTVAGGNGNYGVQMQWAWQGPTGAGGLGLTAPPTAGMLLRLGAAADDADVSGTRKNHEVSINYAGNGGMVYNNPASYGAAVLAASPLPNPTVAAATYVNLTTVNVSCVLNSSATALDPATAQNAANYAMDLGVTVAAAALQADGITVRLTTSTLTRGSSYHLTVTVVQDTLGNVINPNPTTLAFLAPPPTLPVITTATCTNLTQVTLVYSKVIDPITVATATNYALSGGASVSSVTVVNGTTVTLNTTAMAAGTMVTLTVNNVLDQDTPPNAIAANTTRSFTTPVAPAVVSVAASGPTSVTVKFSKTMASATLTNVANYAISGGIAVTAATASGTSATLTVSTLTLGTTYTLSVSNVQDTVGITIAPNPTTTSFVFSYRSVLLQYNFTLDMNPTTVGAGLDTAVSMALVASPSASAVQAAQGAGGYPSGNHAILHTSLITTDSTGAYSENRYAQFQIKPATGNNLMLSTFEFDAAKVPPTAGWFVETSVDGFAAASANVVAGSTIASSRGTWTHYTVDLSAVRFQNLTSTLTLRLYFYSSHSNTDNIDADTFTLYGGVVVPPPVPPLVVITSPTSTFAAGVGSTVSFTATASDPNAGGSITALQFYDGATLLGSAGAAGGGVYTLAWNTADATAGLHNVTARATDNLGLSTVSSPATIINLAAPPGPPTIAITAPTGTCIAGLGNPITLVATASTSNAGGSILDVRFYDGATPLGSGSLQAGTWTYSWTSTSATLGTHSVTAVAVDNTAVTATSAPITVQFLIPGDGNNDGVVDGKDYGVWQNGYGRSDGFMTGDYNGDGIVDGKDYGVWQNNYGHTSASGDVVAAASLEDATAQAPMAAAAPAQATSAPRLIAVTPASGAVASGVTVITLVFDSDVQIGAGAVEVSGLATGPHGDYTATYDAATRTLALTFAAALPADRYTVRVIGSFVVAADGGAALDGAASGMPGSNATAEFAAE